MYECHGLSELTTDQSELLIKGSLALVSAAEVSLEQWFLIYLQRPYSHKKLEFS